jgi:hypothetical protein
MGALRGGPQAPADLPRFAASAGRRQASLCGPPQKRVCPKTRFGGFRPGETAKRRPHLSKQILKKLIFPGNRVFKKLPRVENKKGGPSMAHHSIQRIATVSIPGACPVVSTKTIFLFSFLFLLQEPANHAEIAHRFQG